MPAPGDDKTDTGEIKLQKCFHGRRLDWLLTWTKEFGVGFLQARFGTPLFIFARVQSSLGSIIVHRWCTIGSGPPLVMQVPVSI